jgi:hypothetical protein
VNDEEGEIVRLMKEQIQLQEQTLQLLKDIKSKEQEDSKRFAVGMMRHFENIAYGG